MKELIPYLLIYPFISLSVPSTFKPREIKTTTADATTVDATKADATKSGGNGLLLGIIAGVSLPANLLLALLLVIMVRRRHTRGTANFGQGLSASAAKHAEKSSVGHQSWQRSAGRPIVALSDVSQQDSGPVYVLATEAPRPDAMKASLPPDTYETVNDPKPLNGEDTYDHLKHDEGDSEDSQISTAVTAPSTLPAPISSAIMEEEEVLEKAVYDHLKRSSASG